MKRSIEFKETDNPKLMKGGPEAARIEEPEFVRALFGRYGIVLVHGTNTYIVRYDELCKAVLPTAKPDKAKSKSKKK